MATKPSRIQLYKNRYKDLEAEKAPFLPMYQLIGEYVMTRKQDFTSKTSPGGFETQNIFSSVAPNSNQRMASALVGNLWPNGARSVRLTRPRYIPDTEENKAYYDAITNVYVDVMDSPETGTFPALQEYMLDQGSFGTSGVLVKKTGDLTDPLRLKALNVKYFLIDEDKDGFVDTVFISDDLTAKQIVDEYGLENVSSKVKEAYTNYDIKTKFQVIHLIEPRRTIARTKGNLSYPIASIHFEWETEKILRESGYTKMPAIIGRFLKALGEKQGRSAAMFSMPATMRLNLAWEMIFRAGGKKLKPPLYLLDNGSLGADTIDTSEDALNIFSTMGVGEKSPVGVLYDVGNLQDIFPIVEALVKDVTDSFYIDQLMDLNNEKKMTFGEAQIRDRIRGEGLNSIFKRQETEFFSRLVFSSFSCLEEEGLMGVERGSPEEQRLIQAGLEPIYYPPDVLRAKKRGQKIYKVKYISPASRIMRTEELQGITTLLDMNMAAAQGFPEILDNVDPDKIERLMYDLLNVDEETLRASKVTADIRAARAEMQKQRAQMENMQLGADVMMKTSQAQSMREGAINGRPRG